MCFGGGPDKGEEAAAIKNREIEKVIRADEKKAAKEVKLLLLGKLATYLQPFCAIWQLTLRYYRCRRKWEVDDPEADAVDLCHRLLKARTRRMACHHFQQHLGRFQDHHRCHGGSRHPFWSKEERGKLLRSAFCLSVADKFYLAIHLPHLSWSWSRPQRPPSDRIPEHIQGSLGRCWCTEMHDERQRICIAR